MPARTLTSGQIAWLRSRNRALRLARGERAALVATIVDTARVLHATGASIAEIARPLGVPAELLVAWIDEHTPKTLPTGTPNPARPCVLACTGDPRPGEHDFATELAAIRRHTRPGLRLVEHVNIELVELSRALDEHEPAALHLTAHSTAGCTYLSHDGDPFPVLAEHLAHAVLRATHRPRVILLNVCGSSAVVPFLTGAVDAVVTWPGPADADHCRIVATSVFGLLSRSFPIAAAMADLELLLEAAGVPRNQQPRLTGDTMLRILM